MPADRVDATFDMEVEFYGSDEDGWRWRYRTKNNEVFQASHQSFSSESSCKRNFTDFRRDHFAADQVVWKRVEK